MKKIFVIFIFVITLAFLLVVWKAYLDYRLRDNEQKSRWELETTIYRVLSEREQMFEIAREYVEERSVPNLEFELRFVKRAGKLGVA